MAIDRRSAQNMAYDPNFDYSVQCATNGSITLMPDVELRKWAFDAVIRHRNSSIYTLDELVTQAETLANFVLNGKKVVV